jgi:hypothetical protein
MSMRCIILVVCTLILQRACLEPSAVSGQNNAPVRPPQAPKQVEEIVASYFPAGTFNMPDGSPDKNSWSSLALYLRGIGEPPLPGSADSSDAQEYRFIRIGFPTAKTLVVRLLIGSDGTAKLFAKQTPFNGTTFLLNEELSVSVESVNGFLACAKRAEFWQIPTREIVEQRITDGSYWFVEATRRGDYHMVYRRAPELHPNSFTDIGRYLAKDLAHLPDSVVTIPRGDRSEPVRRRVGDP